jgi:hypothetical protein
MTTTHGEYAGNRIVGEWFCNKCNWSMFPRLVVEAKDKFTWEVRTLEDGETYLWPVGKHQGCDGTIFYDEAE